MKTTGLFCTKTCRKTIRGSGKAEGADKQKSLLSQFYLKLCCSAPAEGHVACEPALLHPLEVLLFLPWRPFGPIIKMEGLLGDQKTRDAHLCSPLHGQALDSSIALRPESACSTGLSV